MYHSKIFTEYAQRNSDVWKLINNILNKDSPKDTEIKLSNILVNKAEGNAKTNYFNDYFVNVGPILVPKTASHNQQPSTVVHSISTYNPNQKSLIHFLPHFL